MEVLWSSATPAKTSKSWWVTALRQRYVLLVRGIVLISLTTALSTRQTKDQKNSPCLKTLTIQESVRRKQSHPVRWIQINGSLAELHENSSYINYINRRRSGWLNVKHKPKLCQVWKGEKGLNISCWNIYKEW